MRSSSGFARPVLATVCATVLAASAQAQSWGTGASFPSVVVRATGVWFAPTARFYVLGGRTSDAAGSDLQSVYEYTPSSDSWALKLAALPTNQNNNMVGGVLFEGGTPYIYVVGGSAAGQTTSTTDVRRYDPVADVMTTITTDPWWGPPANTLPGGAAVFGNKLYVLGGFTINVGMTTQIWEFDPNAAPGSRWSLKVATLPIGLGYVPAATIGSQIYVAGGSTFSGGLLYDTNGTYVYDPVLDSISSTTPIPRVTAETRAVDENGQLWVLGGGRTAPNPSNQVDAYSPGTATWSTAPSFVTARRNIAADVDPASGNIYMVGGYAPSTPTDSMEIFSACGASVTDFCEPSAPDQTDGCTPDVDWTGTPDVAQCNTVGPSDFVVTFNATSENKNANVVIGKGAPISLAWSAESTRCFPNPYARTGAQDTGDVNGAAGCGGQLALDVEAYLQGGNPLLAPVVAGDTFVVQSWYRDPVSSKTTQMSDAASFTVCP